MCSQDDDGGKIHCGFQLQNASGTLRSKIIQLKERARFNTEMAFFFFFFSWRLRKSSYIFQTKHIRWRLSVIERILHPPGLYLTLLTEVSAKVLIISQPPPPGPPLCFQCRKQWSRGIKCTGSEDTLPYLNTSFFTSWPRHSGKLTSLIFLTFHISKIGILWVLALSGDCDG